PTSMVAAASPHTTGCQSLASAWNPTLNTRRNAPNAATFVPADMNAVTQVGAPWYASGVHMWKGTAATLKANPTPSRPIAARARAGSVCPMSLRLIAAMFVVPVAPYASAIPYRKKAEENAPSRKYFMEASDEARRRNEKPVNR